MKVLIFSIFLLLICINFVDAAIIADHNAVLEFDNGSIPNYWINEVKNQRLLIQFPGRSHAQQLVGDFEEIPPDTIGGLEMLEDLDSTYQVNITCNPNDITPRDELRVVKGQYIGGSWGAGPGQTECRNDDDHYWSTFAGRSYTESSANQIVTDLGLPFDGSVFGWSFHIIREVSIHNEEGIDITFNDERRDAYFSALNNFEINAPQTSYIYSTAPTDHDTSPVPSYLGADGLRVTQYNEMIRQEAITNDGVLFDQSDIENYDITMTTPYSPTYLGNVLEVRHSDWGETSDGCAHSNTALCVAKAKAFWWMAARMAGWDGTPACQSSADCGGNACVEGVCQENSISISGAENIILGEHYPFEINFNLNPFNQSEFIQYTNLTFFQPNGNQFLCRIFNHSSINCENLSIAISEDYSNESQRLNYNLTLDLDENFQSGEYIIKAETYIVNGVIETIYVSNNHTFVISEIIPVQENLPSGGGGGGTYCEKGYKKIEGKCVIIEQPKNESIIIEENITEQNISEVVEINENVEVQTETSFFDYITGEVVGTGKSLGLNKPMSYFFTVFFWGIVISGLIKRFRNKR